MLRFAPVVPSCTGVVGVITRGSAVVAMEIWRSVGGTFVGPVPFLAIVEMVMVMIMTIVVVATSSLFRFRRGDDNTINESHTPTVQSFVTHSAGVRLSTTQRFQLRQFLSFRWKAQRFSSDDRFE